MDLRYLTRSRALCALVLIGGVLTSLPPRSSFAGNGSVVYIYDALGRAITASYDTGVIIIYAYDANGNRTQQVINVNSGTAVWGSFNWDAALWG